MKQLNLDISKLLKRFCWPPTSAWFQHQMLKLQRDVSFEMTTNLTFEVFFFTAYHSIFGKLSNVECYFAKHLKTRSSKETWTNLHFNWHFQVLFFSPPPGWVGLDTTTLGCIEGLWRYCQTLTQGESTGGADRDTDGIPGLGDMFVGLSLLFVAASVDCCLYVLRLLCVFLLLALVLIIVVWFSLVLAINMTWNPSCFCPVSYCYDCSQIVEFNFTVLDGKWSSTKRRRMYEYSILCHFTEIG